MHGFDVMAKKITSSFQTNGGCTLHDAKAKQATKLQELGEILVSAGFVTAREQADVLGLSRSTAWNILRGRHKASGLSVSVINRMLRRPLPMAVRIKLLEYIEEKAAGHYGHAKSVRRKFIAQLSAAHVNRVELYKIVQNQAA